MVLRSHQSGAEKPSWGAGRVGFETWSLAVCKGRERNRSKPEGAVLKVGGGLGAARDNMGKGGA